MCNLLLVLECQRAARDARDARDTDIKKQNT